VSEALGEEVTPATPYEVLRDHAARLEMDVDPLWGPGRLVEKIFEETVVPTLTAPTFVRDFPEETSPLTRAHRSTPGVTEKWDLYLFGVEHGTGYSELTDPVMQRERFIAQALAAARGDSEAMRLDEDFIQALEYGMPPAGGMGMGVDRLLMSLTGAGGLRETILFPLVKPE
jgi:lysyl-tRNA synthetase class 2